MARRQITLKEIHKAANGRPFVSAKELETIDGVSQYVASLTIHRSSWIRIGNRKLSLIPCACREINYIHEFTGPFNTLQGEKSGMTKEMIKAELMVRTEGRPFMSVTNLRNTLGCGHSTAIAILDGLTYIKTGKRKSYLVDDIATVLADMREQ
jgi:hypothetical protein